MKRYQVVLGVTLAIAAVLAIAGALDPAIHGAIVALFSDPNAQHTFLAAEGAAVIDPAMVKAALEKISDQVREVGEKALAEAKKGIEMSASAKEAVDGLLIKQGELQARLSEVEQKAARPKGEDRQAPQSAGQMLVDSEEYKAWMAAGGMKSTQSGFVFPVKASLIGIPSSNTTTVGVAPQQEPLVPIAMRRMTIRDLITPGSTNSNLIQYVKETGFTNNAATVSETVQKPESTIVYALMQSAVVTIAHWIKASKQILDDFLALQSNIDGRLRYGLQLVEEAQLLKGSGVGNNLNGIYTQATAYSAPIDPPGTETNIDVLRLMLLQAELALYPSTGIVLHPSNWAAIELLKDTLGRYIIGNPLATMQPMLWGRPVVSTQAMTVDTALVGAFKLGAQLFDREDANVVISTENQDDFIKNMVTIRAEERLALAVYRPEAFIKNTNLPDS